ncbi:MAG: dTMP kinase [Euryarchaeota archaeon]|nr:dTMP kinase [Euryarchaeota archaeon]
MLVALEGIDGSGKTTVARKLAAELRRRGHRVRLTREPTPTWLGRAVRRGIRSGVDPLALACLFLADRATHVGTWSRAPRGEVVITDRYRDSTSAYQAVALRGRVEDPLRFFSTLQDRWFPAPDLAFLLDVPVRVGLARIRGRTVREPFEKIRFLAGVRRNYLRLAREGRLIVLDADRPPEQVAKDAAERIQKRLGPRPRSK